MIKRFQNFWALWKDIDGMKGFVSKVWRVFQQKGFQGVYRKGIYLITQSKYPYRKNSELNYKNWIEQYDTLTESEIATLKDNIDAFPTKPLLSVVMPVFNSNKNYLEAAIQSVRNQIYTHWELCIADDASTVLDHYPVLEHFQSIDPRIKVVFRSENGHISLASNSALEVASGSYMVLLDHDDLLSIDALYWVVEAINRHPDAGIIYSDEDKIDEIGIRKEPYFKSEWNRELFLGHNMISHLGVYQMDLVKIVEGFRKGYEGAQDYDLAARIILLIQPHQIIHIPFVLYHWRIIQGSTAMDINEKPYALIAGEKTLCEFLKSNSIKGRVQSLPIGIYRLFLSRAEPEPSVTIIIPTRNKLKYLKSCIDSIQNLTTYTNYHILIVDNDSDDTDTITYLDHISLQYTNIQVTKDTRPFNYSALMNRAVEHAQGDYIVFLNNDTKIITPDWLHEMISLAMLDGVGAVGAKLLYPNNTLQHGGVILGLGADKVAGHMHHLLPEGNYGYFGRAFITQELSAVSAACMAVKKESFWKVGGFNEVSLPIAFNDIDLCLKLKATGFRNLWTPHAQLYHYESISRGSDYTEAQQLRFQQEVQFMKDKWGELLLRDPAYSPNLSLDFSDFSLAWPPRIDKINPKW